MMRIDLEEAGRLLDARIVAGIDQGLAAAKALVLWVTGVRQEVWEPTRRPA